MSQTDIFAPFFVMIALTFCVWFYMYVKRIPFIRKNFRNMDNVSAEEFQAASPPAVSNPSNNLKNLFEMPIVFYALCLYLFVTQQVDAVYLLAAWVFAGIRVLHSIVHCTFNKVLLRFGLYLISAVALWFIAFRAIINYI